MIRNIILILFSITILIGCSKPSAEEMFNRGVEAQKAQQFNDAIEAYQKLVDTYPDSARAPEALYAIATIYQNSKKSYHQAIATFREFIKKYPNHGLTESALFIIGFIYNNDLKNIDSARITYEEFIRTYPNSPLVSSAKFELETLGKDAGEVLKEKTEIAKAEEKPTKKRKK